MKNSGNKPFLVKYHRLILPEDMPPIPRDWRLRIMATINNRLVVAPSLYGKPLRSPLNGLFKLRVGDYRVVFELRRNIIQVLIIGHRRDVYQRVLSRL